MAKCSAGGPGALLCSLGQAGGAQKYHHSWVGTCHILAPNGVLRSQKAHEENAQNSPTKMSEKSNWFHVGGYTVTCSSAEEEGKPQGGQSRCKLATVRGQMSLSPEKGVGSLSHAWQQPLLLPPQKVHHQLSNPNHHSKCPASPVGLRRVGCVPLRLLLGVDLLGRQPLHHHGKDVRTGGQPAGGSPATKERENTVS